MQGRGNESVSSNAAISTFLSFHCFSGKSQKQFFTSNQGTTSRTDHQQQHHHTYYFHQDYYLSKHAYTSANRNHQETKQNTARSLLTVIIYVWHLSIKSPFLKLACCGTFFAFNFLSISFDGSDFFLDVLLPTLTSLSEIC